MALNRLANETIDLFGLPVPSAIEELDQQTIFGQWLAQLLAINPQYTILLESDPAIKLLEVGAFREMLERQRVNDAVKAVLLPSSYGTNLDVLGARFGVARLTLSPADNSQKPALPAIMEDDDDFRKRIGLAPDAWAAGGPYGAYLYQAYTADPNVTDVQAYNHGTLPVTPGTVVISVLTANDSQMSAAVTNVWKRLHRDDIGLLTDNIIVQPATPVQASIMGTIFVGKGPDPSTVQGAALLSLRDYLARRRKIGKLLPLSGVYSALQVGGVDRVELTLTQDIVVLPNQYVDVTNISLAIGTTL